MPTRTGIRRTRGTASTTHPTPLSEQDTNSPNIVNNILLRSNVGLKNNKPGDKIRAQKMANAGVQMGKSLSQGQFSVFQDENISECIKRSKSPVKVRRNSKGRFVSPVRVKSSSCQTSSEMVDFGVQVNLPMENISPTPGQSQLPDSILHSPNISIDTITNPKTPKSTPKSNTRIENLLLIKSLQKDLLSASDDEISSSDNPKFLKEVIAERDSVIMELSFRIEQMEIENAEEKQVIDKLQEANSALKDENEGLIKDIEEKEAQIEELLVLAEA